MIEKRRMEREDLGVGEDKTKEDQERNAGIKFNY